MQFAVAERITFPQTKIETQKPGARFYPEPNR